MNRQPKDAASMSVKPEGTATRLRSARGNATYCANEPQAVKPGWKSRSQSWVSPRRHGSHTPQPQQNGTVTRAPTSQPRTDGPTETISPQSSWPPTWGRATSGSWPDHACQSLRHTPLASTRRTTPSSPQTGSSTVSSSSGEENERITAARITVLSRSWTR